MPVILSVCGWMQLHVFICLPAWLLTSFHTGLPLRIHGYLPDYLPAYLRSYAATSIRTYTGNRKCLHKRMQIYTCFIQPVLYWRSVAVFGSV